MRSRLAWVVGGVGVAGAFALRTLRRRPHAPPVVEPVPPPDERADELRRKLDEARAVVDDRDEFEGGETTVDRAEPPPSPADRRKHVHERARASVERMQRSTRKG